MPSSLFSGYRLSLALASLPDDTSTRLLSIHLIMCGLCSCNSAFSRRREAQLPADISAVLLACPQELAARRVSSGSRRGLSIWSRGGAFWNSFESQAAYLLLHMYCELLVWGEGALAKPGRSPGAIIHALYDGGSLCGLQQVLPCGWACISYWELLYVWESCRWKQISLSELCRGLQLTDCDLQSLSRIEHAVLHTISCRSVSVWLPTACKVCFLSS